MMMTHVIITFLLIIVLVFIVLIITLGGGNGDKSGADGHSVDGGVAVGDMSPNG